MKRHLKTMIYRLHERLDRMANMLAVDEDGYADASVLARGILGFAIGIGAAEFGTEELKRIIDEGLEEANAAIRAETNN
jgi:hypothetical protein